MNFLLYPIMNDKLKEEEFRLNLPREWYTKKNMLKRRDIVKKNDAKKEQYKNHKIYETKPQITSTLHVVYSHVFMLFNVSILFIILYTILKLLFALKNDINIRIDQEFFKIKCLIEDSRYKYLINRCDQIDIPAMRQSCMIWRNNTLKTRNDVEVLKIVADCFGDIVDRFLEKISWKFFLLGATIVILYLFIFKNSKR